MLEKSLNTSSLPLPPHLLDAMLAEAVIAAQRQQAEKARRAATRLPAPDPAAWIPASVVIEEPQEQDVALIPFALWPAQQAVLATLIAQPQTVILKARQLGLSWLVIAYATWLCLHHAYQNVLVFSKDQTSANEMIRRAKGIYNRLKEKPAQLARDNVTLLEWSNGSRIQSFAATEDAGSSFTASLTILDEFAKMHYADELYTSVKPTINDGGRIIIVSTAKGLGNAFHKLWGAAQKGENSFTPIFLPWTARPTRTPDWYARTAADAVSDAHHKQEYPATSDEAFTDLDNERFLPSMTLWDACREDLPPLGAREPLVLALDAATSSDSFGMVGVTRHPARHEDVAVRFIQEWKPRGGQIDFQGTDDNPGPERVLRRLISGYNVVVVTYDPYQLHDMMTRVRNEGLAWCEEFPQGPGSEKRPGRLISDKQLLDLIVGRRITHDGNAALRQHLDNADRKPDPETRKLRIVKREAALKIDLAVCVSMAATECLRLNL